MKKLINTIMMILLIAAIFVFYTEMMPVKITANDLTRQYLQDKIKADNNFLGKDLEITGTVKAYYKLLDIRNVLEFENDDNKINLYCFFLNDSDEFKARQISKGDAIVVIGKCVGMEKYNFVEGLKMEVNKIK